MPGVNLRQFCGEEFQAEITRQPHRGEIGGKRWCVATNSKLVVAIQSPSTAYRVNQAAIDKILAAVKDTWAPWGRSFPVRLRLLRSIAGKYDTELVHRVAMSMAYCASQQLVEDLVQLSSVTLNRHYLALGLRAFPGDAEYGEIRAAMGFAQRAIKLYAPKVWVVIGAVRNFYTLEENRHTKADLKGAAQ
jgi:hypothetical protein